MNPKNHFLVDYRLVAGTEQEALSSAKHIGIEQSVEMPVETVPESVQSSLPEITHLEKSGHNRWSVQIQYPLSIVDGDPTQFLNVLYGNISLLGGIQITDVSDGAFQNVVNGPAFGMDGIRKILGVKTRPLSCTALKPVGLTAADFAERACKFARGGIDIIKDDHGLANQQPATFSARVAACVQAARRGEQVSGKRTLYFPNITTSPAEVVPRFEEAVELGADGVLISPQLTGIEMMHTLARTAQIPVMAHPAFSGPYVVNPDYGFTMTFYYGKLWRAFGADAIIYPNAGGRFTFSEETCKLLNNQMRSPFCGFKQAFPVPAGGIHLKSIPEWVQKYGRETLFLIGGNLYKQEEGIEKAASQFQQMLEDYG